MGLLATKNVFYRPCSTDFFYKELCIYASAQPVQMKGRCPKAWTPWLFCIAINIFSRSVIIIFFNRNAYSGLFHNIRTFHTLLKLCLILLKLISSPHKGTSHTNRNTCTPASCTLYVPQGWKHIWLTHANQPLLSGLGLLGQTVDVHRARRNKSSFPSLSTILHPQDCMKGKSTSVLQRTFSRHLPLDKVV